jgi:hypothetical protein
MPLPHFAVGQPLTADDANTIARQGVITVPTLTERDAIAADAGMTVYVEATDTLYQYGPSGWRVLHAGRRPYTPSTSGLTLGNGQITAEWEQIGSVVQAAGRIVFGSTSAVTGNLEIGFPVKPKRAEASTAGIVAVGHVYLNDASDSGSAGRRIYVATSHPSTPTRFRPMHPDGQTVGSSTPWTWATGDSIDFTLSYEVAN